MSRRPLFKIKPCIRCAEKNCKNKNHQAGNFDIDDLLHIMDDEGTCVSKGRGMFRSQPDLEMSKGTVPVKYLDGKGKCKAREMEYLGHPIFDSPKGAEKKEHDPEKMNEHNDICKDLIKHGSVCSERPK